jgi:hypothetical protein
LIWKLKAACTKVWRCLVVIIPSLATTTDGFCAALWVEPKQSSYYYCKQRDNLKIIPA